MKGINLSDMSVDQLVNQLADLAVEQDVRLLENDVAAANRLYDEMHEISTELKSRPGDQRTALMALYDHSNMHVRLVAAKKTLAVAPRASRVQLEQIRDSGWMPDAGDAGMCLRNLDDGIFKPT